MAGYFITLEGIEGAGKSSAVNLIAEYLQRKQSEVVFTREPGGTRLAEQIRTILLAHDQEPMHPDTELLLYFAARAQHLHQVIMPALKRGQWVICDRFTDATYAYQGGGRGLSLAKIKALEELVQGALRPDYTLLFDVEVAAGLARIKKNRELDRFEVESQLFFDKVRSCYLQRAALEPQRFYLIDANQPQEAIAKQLITFLDSLPSNSQTA